MFEQALLRKPARTRRGLSVVLGFAGELTVVGVAVLLPLIFFDHLPPLQAQLHISLPHSQKVDPAKVVTLVATPGRKTKAFVEPTTIPKDVPTFVNDEPRIAPLETQPQSIVGLPDGLSSNEPSFNPADPGTTVRPPAPTPTARSTPQPAARPTTIHLSRIDPAALLYCVRPAYPTPARLAHVSGTVRLEAVIATDGSIRELRVTSGPALLVAAAIDAVRQWRYRPTVLNGVPVEVVTTIDVVFTLSQ